MKKLFTFLLSLSITAICFGTTYTWTSKTVGGSWTDASKWSPSSGYPGLPGDEVYFILSGSFTVDNVPSCNIDHMFIENFDGDLHTLNLSSAIDGNTMTFVTTITTPHTYDLWVSAKCTLNCNVSLHLSLIHI